MAIRVVLADDHAVVRNGVRDFLEDEADIEVVGQASNGQEAVDLAVRLQPDVIVMDVAMPELSGVEATKRIRSLAPDVRILALSAFDDEPYVFGLLDAGATGYVLKTADSQEVVRAVRATAAGQSALAPSVATQVVSRVTQGAATAETLTERELSVLRLAARGLTNKQIGANLHIGDRTVQNHLANIYAKLEVASRTEAVTVALQRHLIRLGD